MASRSSPPAHTRERDEEDSPTAGAVGSTMECAVCLQTCVHPARLDCGHIFCFLCVKGVSHASMRCPMCRRDIRPGFLEDPAALLDEELEAQRKRMEDVRAAAERKEAKSGRARDTSGNFDERAETSERSTAEIALSSPSLEDCALDDVRWYYEGRNGWWQYDDRTNDEVEAFHARGESKCELLIAGFLYIIDFEQMLQYRRSDPSRRRRILRDRVSVVPRKGIAGIRAFQMGSQTLNSHPPAAQADQQARNPSSTVSTDSLTDQLSRALTMSVPRSTTPLEATSSEDSGRLSIRATATTTRPQRDLENQPALSDGDEND